MVCKRDQGTKSNSLRNQFLPNSFADFGDAGAVRADIPSYGYPLDEDGNYPEDMRWFR